MSRMAVQHLALEAPSGRYAGFVHLQFGRLVEQSCGNPGVRCCFSQPKQDRRLTHEVLFTDHLFPRGIPAPTRLLGNWGICSNRKYKSALRGCGATFLVNLIRTLGILLGVLGVKYGQYPVGGAVLTRFQQFQKGESSWCEGGRQLRRP